MKTVQRRPRCSSRKSSSSCSQVGVAGDSLRLDQVFMSINANDELNTTFTQLYELGTLEHHQEEQFCRIVLSLTQFGLLSLPVSDRASLYG